ncbi:MAG TPA: type I methionyl aminopeptidase [Actinomycetes bacterium]|nr:type I methionyl aminopeptidase [Actinomycetes bacterium]
MFNKKSRIEIKTPEQFDRMRAAGVVVADTLSLLRNSLTPGMTTLDLDAVARDSISSAGAQPSFLGYHGFPAVVCISVNEEIVHGIPGDRVINQGDVVSIDCGAIVDGWHGDAAFSMVVGEGSPQDHELLRVTEEALWRGLAQAVAGGRLSDIGHAVQTHVRAAGDYGIVEEYVGHGIGTSMHMDPSVPNYGEPGHGPQLTVGMALAVEPMVNLGSRHTRVLGDDWTVVTQDGRRSAHFEHTVAITELGPWVLTAHDGGAARFAALGVPTPAKIRS